MLYGGAAEERIAELTVRLQDLSDQFAFEEAFALAAQDLPTDAPLEGLWDSFSSRRSLIQSDPLGAVVSRRPYDAPDRWEPLGATPLPDVRLPVGLSVLRFELDGREAVEMAIPTFPFQVSSVEAHLPAQGEVPTGMVRIPAGRAAIPNYNSAGYGHRLLFH